MAVKPSGTTKDPHQIKGRGWEEAGELHEQEKNDRERGGPCDQEEVYYCSRRDGVTKRAEEIVGSAKLIPLEVQNDVERVSVAK